MQRYWEPPFASQIACEQGSVLDVERLGAVMRQHSPSLTRHAAAITAVDPVSEATAGAKMVEVNGVGTPRILEVPRQSSVRYVSSSGVYGFSSVEAPISETAQLPEQGIGLVHDKTTR